MAPQVLCLILLLASHLPALALRPQGLQSGELLAAEGAQESSLVNASMDKGLGLPYLHIKWMTYSFGHLEVLNDHPVAVEALVGKVHPDRFGYRPEEETRAKEFFQCDRQCRWFYGFFKRSIVGVSDHRMCYCYDIDDKLEWRVSLPEFSKKLFDTENTWSGAGTTAGFHDVHDHREDEGHLSDGADLVDSARTGFNCKWVCVEERSTGWLHSLPRAEAVEQSWPILHCGRCAACSAPEDIKVVARTRSWITAVMTKVSSHFAAPWGHHDSKRLADDLVGIGFTVSRERPDGRKDLPTCMDCWVDNIMCDSRSCKKKCWIKFFKSANPRTSVTGKISRFDFNAKCLKCDEEFCGPEFIKCAGANRRSAGIISDIQRPKEQECTVGMYHNVPEEQLPTAPEPGQDYVKHVLELPNGAAISAAEQEHYQKTFDTHLCCCSKTECWWFPHSRLKNIALPRTSKCPQVDKLGTADQCFRSILRRGTRTFPSSGRCERFFPGERC